MSRDIRTRRERWEAFWGRRTRVGKVTLVLFAVFCVCTFLLMFGVLPTLDTTLNVISVMAMTPLVLVLLFRWFTFRVLWRVRNRLILTYLLMGLAPLVMFVTLMGIASYLLAGQYATNVGLSRLTEGLTRVRDQAGSAAVFGSPAGPGSAKTASAAIHAGKTRADESNLAILGGPGSGGSTAVEDATPLSLMEWKGKAWVPLEGMSAKDNAGPLTSGAAPAWLHPGFQGIVELQGKLYLCAEVGAPRNGRPVVVLASRPLTREELDVMAKGLGRILLSQAFSHLASDADKDTADTESDHDNDPDMASEKDSKPVHVNVVVPKDSGSGDGQKPGNVHVTIPNDSDTANAFYKVSSGPLTPVELSGSRP